MSRVRPCGVGRNAGRRGGLGHIADERELARLVPIAASYEWRPARSGGFENAVHGHVWTLPRPEHGEVPQGHDLESPGA